MDRNACLAKAAELEQMARLVSYGPDRQALARQAETWRARGEELWDAGASQARRQASAR